MKVLASYNVKGGVGKTAAAVNLAHLSSQAGYRTLLWDLDPQGAASYCFRVKRRIKGGGEGLVEKRDLARHVTQTDYRHLDLVPADLSYRNLDLILDDHRKPTRRLGKLLRGVAKDYDHVYLDCAPSLSLVSESVFAAADVLLVPTIPTTLSLQALKQVRRFLEGQDGKSPQLLAFYSMVDRRKSLHREVLTAAADSNQGLASTMMSSYIPYASEVERMAVRRAPLTSFGLHSRAGLAFRQLWFEVQAQLEQDGSTAVAAMQRWQPE